MLLVEKLGAFAPTGSKENNEGEQISTKINWNRYLNVGTGKAWAWQSNPKLWPSSLSMVLLRRSFENLGPFDPIGSKVQQKYLSWFNISDQTYLNIGVGDACAGHNRAMLLPEV